MPTSRSFRILPAIALAMAAMLAAVDTARAIDQPLPGTTGLTRLGRTVKLVGRAARGEPDLILPVPGSATDPRNNPSSFRRCIEDDSSDPCPRIELNPANWEALGNPAGSRGWRYRGAGTPADPCTNISLKDRVVTATCEPAAAPGFEIPVGLRSVADELVTGDLTYCARFPFLTTRTDNPGTGTWRATRAPAPADCTGIGGTVDVPIPGTLGLTKRNRRTGVSQRTRLVSRLGRADPPFPIPGQSESPADGESSIRRCIATSAAAVNCGPIELNPANWRGLGRPAGSAGWRYRGDGTPADPCRLIIVKDDIIRFDCVGAGAVDPTFIIPVGSHVVSDELIVGDYRYCTSFPRVFVRRDRNQQWRATNAPAPNECPEIGVPNATPTPAPTSTPSPTSTPGPSGTPPITPTPPGTPTPQPTPDPTPSPDPTPDPTPQPTATPMGPYGYGSPVHAFLDRAGSLLD